MQHPRKAFTLFEGQVKLVGPEKMELKSPGTSTRLKLVPANQVGFSVPPVIPYDGPPPSSRRTFFFPLALSRLAVMMPAGPEPTTMTSHWVVANGLGARGVAETKPMAWSRRKDNDSKAAMVKFMEMEIEMEMEREIRDGL